MKHDTYCDNVCDKCLVYVNENLSKCYNILSIDIYYKMSSKLCFKMKLKPHVKNVRILYLSTVYIHLS